MINRLLPIGSVVSLNFKKETPFVILGYSPEIDGASFDYSASVLPIGLVLNGAIIGFNRSQIDKVIFEGYRDQKFELLSDLKETLANESLIK